MLLKGKVNKRKKIDWLDLSCGQSSCTQWDVVNEATSFD